MMLRAVIVFLLMLNLGVAAWWLAGGADQREAASTVIVDDGTPGLRLVNEPVVSARVVAPPPTTAALAVALNPPVAGPASTPEQAPVPPAPAIAPALCLTFGPFSDAGARDAVRATLQPQAQRVVARDARARSAGGWRVYLPALATRESAQQVVDNIKAAGINDWYIIANGSEANSIALGRYGSEDSARRRQAELAAKGFQARAEPLGDTPPQWWLDARFAPAASRATLAAIAPSNPLDCARLQ